jgi:protein SCO1/2
LLPAVLLATVCCAAGMPAGVAEAATLPAFDRVRVLPAPRTISELELTNQDGEAFGLQQLRGRVTLVFFGFTHCPDVCPMALQRLRQLAQAGGEALAELAYVMISVDGERDSPAVVRDYLAQFSPSFIGLTGDPDRVRALASQFSAAFFKEGAGADGNYEVSHSPQVFVLDRSGQLRAEFYNAGVDAMLAVSRALLDEARLAGAAHGEPGDGTR